MVSIQPGPDLIRRVPGTISPLLCILRQCRSASRCIGGFLRPASSFGGLLVRAGDTAG